MRVLLLLERLFSSVSKEYLKQLMGVASEDEIFMESQLLKYKSAIKFQLFSLSILIMKNALNSYR